MKQAITMRPLLLDDAAFLCSLFKDNAEYYHIFYDSETSISEWEKRVARFIQQNQVSHYIVEAEKASVGWLSFSSLSSTEQELDILVIQKEFLRCRYGTAALSWFIEKCRCEAVRSISLNVNQSNTRAISFYQKFGFEIVGEEIIPQCNDAVNLAQYKMKLTLM